MLYIVYVLVMDYGTTTQNYCYYDYGQTRNSENEDKGSDNAFSTYSCKHTKVFLNKKKFTHQPKYYLFNLTNILSFVMC